MQVVAHQDKRLAPETIPPAVAFKAFEIRGKIRVGMQEGRAPVAGGNPVIEGTGEFDTRFSSHSRNLQEEGQNESILMPDRMPSSAVCLAG
jgi:hypothetical protein